MRRKFKKFSAAIAIGLVTTTGISGFYPVTIAAATENSIPKGDKLWHGYLRGEMVLSGGMREGWEDKQKVQQSDTESIVIDEKKSDAENIKEEKTISAVDEDLKEKENEPSPIAPPELHDPIKHILIEGNVKLSTEDVMKFITNTKIDEAYDKANVKKDLEAIAEAGIVQSVKAKAVQNNGELYVVFEVTELSEVKNIQISGNTLVETEQLLEVLVTKKGEQFSPEIVKQDIENIKGVYRDAGYIAIVNDVNNDDGNITYNICEAKIADIVYKGNSKTRDWVLDKITKKYLKRGEFLTQKALENTYTGLMQTGFFKDVNITANEGSSSADVILEINITENRTGQWRLGGAYSQDYGVEAVGGISETNLGGTAKSVNFDLGFGKNRNHFSLSYVDPYFRKSDTMVYAKIFKTGKDVDNDFYEYNEEHLGGEIGFSKPVSQNQKTRFYGNFRVDKIDVSDQKKGPELKSLKANTVTLGIINDNREEGQVNGTVLQGEATASAKFLGSDESYTKFTARMKNYLQISAKNTLASRLEFRYSPNDLPGIEKFTIGGSDSVRGLDEDAQRGNKSVLASLEFRHDFNDKVQGVVFVDAGKAWAEEINNSFKAAAGIGVRVKTALGTLRMDIAKAANESVKFIFGIGQSF